MKPPHLTSGHSASPSLSALQAFERAAVHLSFLRAARDLSLTPSAVSHRIRGLEQKFGVRLFTRAGRAIRLTAAGQQYLETVKASLAALEQGGRELQRHGADAQEIRISALPFFTSVVIIPALAEFRKRFPGVALKVEATNQYADFDRTSVDIAIRYGRERPVGLRFEPLIDVHSVPVCSPEIARRLRTPADLARETLIHVSVQPAAWPAWLNEAKVGGRSSRDDLWFDNVLSALDAAEQGLGVALAMYPLIRARSGFRRALVTPFSVRAIRSERFYMVCRSEHARSKRMVVLRRWLAAAVRRAIRT